MRGWMEDEINNSPAGKKWSERQKAITNSIISEAVSAGMAFSMCPKCKDNFDEGLPMKMNQLCLSCRRDQKIEEILNNDKKKL